jgi:pimeloyl-ACP methyl ester carboxylesterase
MGNSHQLRCRAGLFAAALVLAGCAPPAATRTESQSITEEAVHFTSGSVALAGTLIMPEGPGRHPAVVLFHGSGPQSRDLFTARWFGTHGIAALAYDKRGVGESTGNFRSVPFMELTGDGLAGVEYLKTRKDIDARHLGVWGLSQGGWLGPLAASRSSDVSFVIAVSGPGVSPGDQMIFFYGQELEAGGLSERDVQEASALRRDVWHYLSSGEGYAKAKAELQAARERSWYHAVKMQRDDLFAKLQTPEEVARPDSPGARWFKKEAIYDPVPALEALRVPTLFVFGDHDRLVPVAESIAIIRRVQTNDAGHAFSIRVLGNVDHVMNSLTGDRSGELSPEYLQTMKEWLTSHVPGAR